MKQFQEQIELYRLCGGMHASALSVTKNLLVPEDIRQHNTMDKIQGECLFRGLSAGDGLLPSTSRVSSEVPLLMGASNLIRAEKSGKRTS